MLWRQLIPSGLWSMLITLFSVMPAQKLRELQVDHLWTADKLGHFAMYCILAFMLSVGFRKQYDHYLLRMHHLMFAFLLATSFGLLLELVQAFFVEGRAGTLNDQLANMAGGAIGLLLFVVIYGKTAQVN